MKLHRFFTSEAPIGSKTLRIRDQRLLHQWRRVLRLAPGSRLTLFDAEQNEVTYEVKQLNQNEALLTLHRVQQPQSPDKEVWLAWSLLKRENNELVVQKATELGVSGLVPLLAERCIRSDVSKHRADRWGKITIEAAEQCGRSDLPLIRPAISPAELLADSNFTPLICDASGTKPLDLAAVRPPPIIMIGPEGGWSEQERELFSRQELATFSLGEFTLRAETAAIAAMALSTR